MKAGMAQNHLESAAFRVGRVRIRQAIGTTLLAMAAAVAMTATAAAQTVTSSPPAVSAAPAAPAPGKVPMPRLRPGSAGQSAPAVRPSTPAAVVVKPTVPATPGFVANPNSKYTPDQQLALVRITTYFNSFRTMEGKFVQVGPTGEQSEGTFNLSRPGNIRFHYNPPSKLDVIADGRSVAIRDGAARTQDIYPLSKTPLRYLLADQVDLTNERLVDSVREDPDLISVLIIEKTPFVDGNVVLIFDRKTFTLRQWIVTDAQGLKTSVAIYNTSTDKPQDARQFVISSTF
jgi:outer membrane lipoprotein-sorting protein